MADRSVEAVFAAIIEDCQAVAVEAVKNAAKKTQKDIVREAYRYMAKYYANYHPDMYVRTKSLHKAITPVFEDHSAKNGISIEVGVEYDVNKLTGIYYSNSWYHKTGTRWISRRHGDFDYDSQNNGMPDPSWILKNFLEGEHGGAQQDSESTNTLMKDFFETKLPNYIGRYVQEELFEAIKSRL